MRWFRIFLFFLTLPAGCLWSLSADPPDGYTGAPGDAKCTDCHSSAAATQDSSDIDLSLPATYVPGAEYTLTLTIFNDVSGNNGFEVTTIRAGDNSHANAGAWKSGSAGVNSKISGNYWKHGQINTATSYTVSWIAPAAGNGSLRFYGAANKGGAQPNGNFHFRVWVTSEAQAGASSNTDFSGFALGTTSIKWSWSAVLSASSFTVVSSTGGALATLPAPATAWVEAGLVPNTAYARYLLAISSSNLLASSTITVATAEAAASVGAAGGVLIGGDGLTRVTFPAGALSSSGDVLLSLDPAAKPVSVATATLAAANTKLGANSHLISGALREFLFIVSQVKQTGNFSLPVAITIPYSDVDDDGFVDGVSPRLDETKLGLYALNEQAANWESAGSATVNAAANTISAEAGHFSAYALIGIFFSENLGSVVVYPNPYKPGSGGSFDAAGITFANLTSQATIRIFSLTGELIRELAKTAADGDRLLWDGANSWGKALASGVYLYSVTNESGRHQAGRVAIVR